MPSLAKKPLPPPTENRPAAAEESAEPVTVLVNGRRVTVTVAEGSVRDARQHERDHQPDRAVDYLPDD
jgi:hypothetical protein